ncbi:MAG: hypothetical protein PHH11_15945, partial [Methylomonas sp.]|nr:hypothetical protein [Methylomonas sp.]
WHNPVFPMAAGHGILSQTITASRQPSRSDCFFNWAEIEYASLFSPAGGGTQSQSPYVFRYYSATNSYLGISSADSHVYYLGPDSLLLDAGELVAWLNSSGC